MGIEDYNPLTQPEGALVDWAKHYATVQEQQQAMAGAFHQGALIGGALKFSDLFPQASDYMVWLAQSNVPGLNVRPARDYVDEWAGSWMQDIGGWPTVGDALYDPGFTMGAFKLPVWADQLPELFVVQTGQGPVLFDNSSGVGPFPVPVDPANYPPQWTPSWDDPQQGAVGFEHAAPQLPSGIPVVSQQDFQAYQLAYQDWAGQYVGGGGGGGAGRTAPSFDRRYLEESIRSQWEGMLLEIPGNLSRLVDGYIGEATSFYLDTGTQVNLQAWLMEQIRKAPRYRTLYANKPPGMTESQYMGRVSGTVSQFGLDPGTTMRETISGMSSPVNLSSFSERLSNLRQYRQGNLGDLSSKFSSVFSDLGVLRGS